VPVPTGVLTPTRRRGAALVLAAGLGLLTACSSDDTADASGGTTSSASSSSSSAASTSAAGTTSTSTGTAGSSSNTAATAITATEKDFSIDLDNTTVAAGNYTITVANDGRATHDLVVEKDGKDVAKSGSISPGGSGTVTVSLQPGDYVFYCSVGNHRAMGMEVSVTVS
jgi:plastocyanin